LDFAGGAGNIYFRLLDGLTFPERIEWHIVEHPALIKTGEQCMRDSDKDRLRFFEDLPERRDVPNANKEPYHIVHTSTCLQYFEDPYAEMVRLLAYKPRYFMLMRFEAGEHASFTTAQYVQGHPVPNRILDIREVFSFFAENGYSPLYFGTNSTRRPDLIKVSIPKALLHDVDIIFTRDAPPVRFGGEVEHGQDT
jgi:putative methyltransferase (TIGR04325 family)